MASTCSSEPAVCVAQVGEPASTAPEAPVAILQRIVRTYGTPAFAYHVGIIPRQAAKLRQHLADVDVLYSLKANPSLGLCGIMAECGLGADVATAGEMVTARAAGFAPNRICVTGPDRSPALIAQLRELPE